MTRGQLGPEALLAAARSLLGRSDAATLGIWPRAAAQLTRQALEDLLDRFWQDRVPAMERVSRRAQLICLREYLRPRELAGSLAQTWSQLSNACHAHPYELAPTVAEIEGWIASVEELCAARS